MPSIALDDTPFSGVSRSFTHLAGHREHAKCVSCGSSLAGRFERRKERVIGGARMIVDSYRCRCGRGRQIRRELAA